MFMHARALMSARTVKNTPPSCLSISLLSENYYTKVKNVIYGAYERTWPFHIKQDAGNQVKLQIPGEESRHLKSWTGLKRAASFSRIFTHTVRFALQNNQGASGKSCRCLVLVRQPGPLSFQSFLFIHISKQISHVHGAHYEVHFYRAPQNKSPLLYLLLGSSRSRFSTTWFKVFHTLALSHFLLGCQSGPMIAESNPWQGHWFISL